MTGTSNAIDQNTNQFLKLAGGTMAGAINMGSHLISAVTDPVSAQDAATKNYVDSTAQGLNPKPSSVAASTVALTVTYNNGSSGVGATLTNAGAMAAFSLDGVSPSVGDVVLIKDQASTLQNGLYTLTTVGSGAANWVLTRSVYMDAPSEFKGGYTFVISGTVNAGRSYVETATVAAVGTDPVTFTQFSQSKQLVVVLQKFTSNGTYTPTSGMVNCIVEGVGGGGGSGGASVGAGVGVTGGAGGGAYFRKLFNATELGASASVTIGSGGAGGAAGNNNGSNGGDTIFDPAGSGVTLTAGGGSLSAGKAGVATPTIALPGQGGAATNGDVNITGGAGSFGVVVIIANSVNYGGMGGGSYFSPMNSPYTQGGGNATAGYGSGGPGTNTNNGGADIAGQTGQPGIVIVTEYCLQ